MLVLARPVVVKRGKVVVDQFVVDGIYRLELFPR